ncbi:MAG: hypothetical protein DRI34_02585 [Deltaproteobacteria bacterium]|nr:MAG: hypothetical protein DRI34_02585 [Deltaproteobacteria bacterium]
MASRERQKVNKLRPSPFLVVALVAACAAGPRWRLDDPAGDDHGPGGYRYPESPVLVPGSCDLRAVVLGREGADWVLEVSFARPVRRARLFLTRDEVRRVFLQTVDVYLRLAGSEPAHRQALPGRRVLIAGGWHKAVVLSPVPGLLAEALGRSTDLAGDVYLPKRVRVSGRRLRARLPAAFLGGRTPRAVAVLVGGSRLGQSFRLADRLRGTLAPVGLLMPVLAHPGPCRPDDEQGPGCHFSGCAPCGNHPNVVDILAPVGLQEKALSGYDVATGRLAEVPAWPLAAAGGETGKGRR